MDSDVGSALESARARVLDAGAGVGRYLVQVWSGDVGGGSAILAHSLALTKRVSSGVLGHRVAHASESDPG